MILLKTQETIKDNEYLADRLENLEDLFVDVLNERKFPFVNGLSTRETDPKDNREFNHQLARDTDYFYQIWRNQRLKQEKQQSVEGTVFGVIVTKFLEVSNTKSLEIDELQLKCEFLKDKTRSLLGNIKKLDKAFNII